MQRIALLGLGTMGAGMAANWLAKGFPLSVWNRTLAMQKIVAIGNDDAGNVFALGTSQAGTDWLLKRVSPAAAAR